MTLHNSASESAESSFSEIENWKRGIEIGEVLEAGDIPLSRLIAEADDPLDAAGALATSFARKGAHEEAIAVVREFVSRFGGAEKWRTLASHFIADRFVNLGRLDEAMDAYRELAERAADDLEARAAIRYINHLKRADGQAAQRYVPKQKGFSARQEKNLERNEKEFEAGATRLQSSPPHLFLESTTKCNFACKTCSKGYEPYYAEDLHEDILKKVERELMPDNTRISITGFGEPTMASDFDRILSMALDNGSHTHFVTNGSFLTPGRLEQLTRCPVDISISMDGATKETFESIRVNGNFERTIERLAMIKKLRDIHISETFARFHFIFVALRKNIHELPDVVRLAHRFGIDGVDVADYAFNYREFDEQSPRFDPQLANRWLQEAKQTADSLGTQVGLPTPYEVDPPPMPRDSVWEKVRRCGRIFSEANRFPRRCSSPWSEPYIHTDGRVTPCCSSGQYLGSLMQNSFREIWNGWRYRLLRWRIGGAMPPLECRNCFVHWGINGGNAGNVKSKEGLLIKAFYVLESRARRFASFILQKRRAIFSRTPPPAPQPNFYQGKPIRENAKSKTDN